MKFRLDDRAPSPVKLLPPICVIVGLPDGLNQMTAYEYRVPKGDKLERVKFTLKYGTELIVGRPTTVYDIVPVVPFTMYWADI